MATTVWQRGVTRGALLAACSLLGGIALAEEALPLPPSRPLVAEGDWLIDEPREPARVYCSVDEQELVLDNGLIRRVIRLVPNAATIALDDLRNGASLVRAVRPEALVTLDGREWSVGGLVDATDQAYLTREEIAGLTDDGESFRLTGYEVALPEKPVEWKRTRHAPEVAWPPQGVALVLHFQGRAEAVRNVRVDVRYELYDGLPVVAKSLTITNDGATAVTVDGLTVELLAATEGESAVDSREAGQWRRPPIDVLSDYMFHGMDSDTANRVAQWLPDPKYDTQVSYGLQTPCLLVCRPPLGPGRVLAAGETLRSFRVLLVLQDSSDRERQGLTLRRTWRAVAPWVAENPLMMHVRHSDRRSFRLAVDQCAAVGFEMIIYTFGSGLDMERDDPLYLARIKEDVDYAHARGVQVGGYSLFSSRRIDDANDAINPATGNPGGTIFGNAPCLESTWGQQYLRKIQTFMETTSLDLLEHDGPYPGDPCASTSHPGHRGLADSQWNQWEASRRLYTWCRERGVYVNQPDCYFLCGGSKTGMGYRETNWSLPREQQLLHARQNMFDGTWTKTVTMGWMFVPLTEYHGGGAAATLEPLGEHLEDYERHLMNCLGMGVQACYRGPRLYDGDATREMLAGWVRWFKEYRDILESDVIHARRADGRDLDYVVHVNPRLERKGLAVVYNPLAEPVKRQLKLPLYYTGLEGSAMIREQEGLPRQVPLDGRGDARVEVEVPARGMTWLVVE